jgi:hypothetical protein
VLEVLIDPVADRHSERGRALQLERRNAVERAPFVLRRLGQAQHGRERRTHAHEALLECIPHLVRPRDVHPADAPRRVLHEPPAHLIPRVADAVRLDVVGGEQQPWVLDRAAREHVMACLHGAWRAGERPDRDMAHGIRVRGRLQMNRVGVQHDGYARGIEEVAARRRREAFVPLVEAPEARRELERIERIRGKSECRPDVVLVVEIAKVELRMRGAIVRIEIRAADRPAASRDPFAAFEVDRIEQSAASAPDAERAAEEPQPRLVEVVVRHPDVVASIQVLRRLLEVEAAAFEQADVAAERKEPPRQRDAGNARADDADVVLGNGGVALCSQIDQHRGDLAFATAGRRPASTSRSGARFWSCHQQLHMMIAYRMRP